ncbi:MAG: Hsp20/alpha crystallin family protein [Leptospiraceae bacterium]|nr:Hsp20/alpha crystallin family protein [Leptospiraceae bacterium]MDW7975622.1 Hsp20/alpha crystallin family protein [Leptospiraceae bacterium]
MMWNRWDEYLWNDVIEFMNTINETLRSRERYPKFRVYENDDGILLKSEIPGVEPENIQIELQDNNLVISVEKKQDQHEGATLLRNEREFGKFTRTFQLPFKVKDQEIQAEYKLGILTIVLPKADEEKPKRIAIKS